jgi:pimeloyl-ACP methyl ester carboxylesterase
MLWAASICCQQLTIMIRDNFISYNSSKLHYAKAGNGERALLVFHGFGQDYRIYESLVASLRDTCTLFVFDLYFHGDSVWAHHEKPLSKKEWKETIGVFLDENKLKDFSVVGFSLGGKFALATIEAYPKQAKEIFLIAPDGIKTSFWYSLATYPIAFRKFFKSMILHHNRFLVLAKQLNRFNLVDKGLIRFAEYQMNTVEKRKRVYYSWVVFRHLRFNQHVLASLIKKFNIQLTIITGKFDKVITSGNMEKFLSLLINYRFETVEAGHSSLLHHPRIVEYLKADQSRKL